MRRGRIADSLWAFTIDRGRLFAHLSPSERQRLRDLANGFLDAKRFYGIGSLVLTDRMRVLIAAQACLPVLHLGLDWYRGWSSILLAPAGFSVDQRDVDSAGVVHEYEDELAGQVLGLGPVVVSWSDVRRAGGGEGYCVVIHEMAHKLDDRDGELDGRPPLPRGIGADEWRDVFGAAFEDRRSDRSPGNLVDEYAGTSAEEFFAVSVEYFFDAPRRLAFAYPEVYALLAGFFKQDPAGETG